MKLIRFARPSWRLVLISAILLGASSLVVRQYVAKSKVHWEIETGWPMAYLRLTRYHGPCGPLAGCSRLSVRPFGVSLCDPQQICLDFSVTGLDPWMLMVDAFVSYVAASLISHALSAGPVPQFKAIVTGRR